MPLNHILQMTNYRKFLEVQGLRLSVLTARPQVQSLIGDLRSCNLHITIKKKKKVIFILCEFHLNEKRITKLTELSV